MNFGFYMQKREHGTNIPNSAASVLCGLLGCSSVDLSGFNKLRVQQTRAQGADLVHIDGDHDPAAARADLRNAKSVARSGAWVVFDDTCFSPLKAVWAEMLETKLISVPQRQFCATSRHSSYGPLRTYVLFPAH